MRSVDTTAHSCKVAVFKHLGFRNTQKHWLLKTLYWPLETNTMYPQMIRVNCHPMGWDLETIYWDLETIYWDLETTIKKKTLDIN